MLIERILGNIEDFDDENLNVDTVLLSHLDMKKPHQKVVTSEGKTLKISLDRGQNLSCGAVLYFDDELLIAVDMPEEKVFEIIPKGIFQWSKAAYNIGNMHSSIYLYSDRIKVPYDSALVKMIHALGIQYRITESKLDGDQLGVSIGHSHSHSAEREGGCE